MILLLILALLVGGLGFVLDLVVLGLALGVVLAIAGIVVGRRPRISRPVSCGESRRTFHDIGGSAT